MIRFGGWTADLYMSAYRNSSFSPDVRTGLYLGWGSAGGSIYRSTGSASWTDGRADAWSLGLGFPLMQDPDGKVGIGTEQVTHVCRIAPIST